MLETFRALAEPSRLQIFELLADGPLPVNAVSDALGIRQPQASKHLRVLNEAGLVEVRPDAQRRIYALRTQPLQDLDIWLQRYRAIWEEQFERLDAVLQELKAAEKSSTKEKKRTRPGAKRRKPR